MVRSTKAIHRAPPRVTIAPTTHPPTPELKNSLLSTALQLSVYRNYHRIEHCLIPLHHNTVVVVTTADYAPVYPGGIIILLR